MMFPVNYVTPLRFGKLTGFVGKGAVHLLETAIALEGMLPRIRPLLLLSVYYRLFCGHTARTVPYAAVERHEPPGVFGTHLLLYWLPDGTKHTRFAVGFGLEDRSRDAELTHRMHEHIRVARSFEGRPAT
jgi:hypothetical protein